MVAFGGSLSHDRLLFTQRTVGYYIKWCGGGKACVCGREYVGMGSSWVYFVFDTLERVNFENNRKFGILEKTIRQLFRSDDWHHNAIIGV